MVATREITGERGLFSLVPLNGIKGLDGFCKQGGASIGYHDAGFDMTGIDLEPQPRYPFTFVQGDFLEYAADCWREYDFIHTSPPCQWYSKTWQINSRFHPDLIPPVRKLLQQIKIPWIIENVPEAPLHFPVTLCGTMFGLRTYRHRLFETSGFQLTQPEHPKHVAKNAKMGRPVKDGEFLHIVGNFSGVQLARDIMEMPHADRDGLREAIPAAYSRYVGTHLARHLSR